MDKTTFRDSKELAIYRAERKAAQETARLEKELEFAQRLPDGLVVNRIRTYYHGPNSGVTPMSLSLEIDSRDEVAGLLELFPPSPQLLLRGAYKIFSSRLRVKEKYQDYERKNISSFTIKAGKTASYPICASVVWFTELNGAVKVEAKIANAHRWCRFIPSHDYAGKTARSRVIAYKWKYQLENMDEYRCIVYASGDHNSPGYPRWYWYKGAKWEDIYDEVNDG